MSEVPLYPHAARENPESALLKATLPEAAREDKAILTTGQYNGISPIRNADFPRITMVPSLAIRLL